MVPATSSTWTAHLTGRVHVALPRAAAFRLFTPVGEKDWADGWDPQFPAGGDGDGSQPGTVFTVAHGDAQSTWVVCCREDGELVEYARVIPDQNAGTVTVRLADVDDGCEATVTYHLTALTNAGAEALQRFERHYRDYMAEWETAIAAALR